MRRNVHFDIAAIMFAYWTWFVPCVMVKDVEGMVCDDGLRVIRLFDNKQPGMTIIRHVIKIAKILNDSEEKLFSINSRLSANPRGAGRFAFPTEEGK